MNPKIGCIIHNILQVFKVSTNLDFHVKLSSRGGLEVEQWTDNSTLSILSGFKSGSAPERFL